jgi:hypothetical protein
MHHVTALTETADGGDDLRIWCEAANILNKRPRSTDKLEWNRNKSRILWNGAQDLDLATSFEYGKEPWCFINIREFLVGFGVSRVVVMSCLLGYNALRSVEKWRTYQRSMSPPLLGSKDKWTKKSDFLIEATYLCKTSVDFLRTTQHYIPELVRKFLCHLRDYSHFSMVVSRVTSLRRTTILYLPLIL